MSQDGGSFRRYSTLHLISRTVGDISVWDERDKVRCPLVSIRKEKVSESTLQAGIQCLPIPLLSPLGCKAVSEVEGM